MNQSRELFESSSETEQPKHYSCRSESPMPSFEVLVVSSDPVLLRHIADILVTLGIEPARLTTLRECHEILAKRPVGLVFCDSHMTDGSYQDFLAVYPAVGDKPRVVVASRTADWDEYEEAIRSGAFDLIPVPCRHIDVEWIVIQSMKSQRESVSAFAKAEKSALAKTAGASHGASHSSPHVH
jgi:DNA-binding NtrC family response regulator